MPIKAVLERKSVALLSQSGVTFSTLSTRSNLGSPFTEMGWTRSGVTPYPLLAKKQDLPQLHFRVLGSMCTRLFSVYCAKIKVSKSI